MSALGDRFRVTNSGLSGRSKPRDLDAHPCRENRCVSPDHIPAVAAQSCSDHRTWSTAAAGRPGGSARGCVREKGSDHGDGMILARCIPIDHVACVGVGRENGTSHHREPMVPLAGIEPAFLSELDFESSASTNSATGALSRSSLGRGLARKSAHYSEGRRRVNRSTGRSSGKAKGVWQAGPGVRTAVALPSRPASQAGPIRGTADFQLPRLIARASRPMLRASIFRPD